jgi:phosphohistidine phosphatase
MILYFLRHGLAGDKTKWQSDDRLRPLTQEGNASMIHTAERIAALNLGLDLIISSPLVRAYQTAEIVARRLAMMDNLVQDERLAPGVGFQGLAGILAGHFEDTIMLVGHEPDFSGMLTTLIGGGKLVLQKGGVARVDLTSNEPLLGKLVWLLPRVILAD